MSLNPHRSFFKLRGIVVGKDTNDKFLRTGKLSDGREYQAVNFGVKTSDKQVIYVEKFAIKNDKAYAYNKNEGKTLAIDWDKRNNPLPNGYKLITPDWDIVEKIKNEINDGDSVVVTGELDYQEYNEKIIVKQIVKNIFKTSEPVNFSAEDFKEEAIFSQEMTINNVEHNKEEEKLYVNVWIFKNRGQEKPIMVTPAVFTLDINKNKKFAGKVARLKLGDTFKADGLIHNRVETAEAEQNDEWGTIQTVIRNTIREYEITGIHAETYEPKLYKESEIMQAIEALNAEKTFGDDNGVTFNETDLDELPF